MKELSFYYSLKIEFSNPIENHRFTLRCVPLCTERQEIINLNVQLQPSASLGDSIDSFGNHCIFGYAKGPHTLFQVEVQGLARTGLSPYKSAGKPHQMGLYRYQTDYTMPGPKLREFYRQFSFTPEQSNYDKSLSFMNRLYEVFRYEPGATNYRTSAEEAFALGKGVCQDYSHILISLCRMSGIPARYVVGMLEGEGASHAWTEIYDQERWIALDPTNLLVVDDRHIQISAGRDYNDCILNQGLFTGQVFQKQKVKVIVKESEETNHD